MNSIFLFVMFLSSCFILSCMHFWWYCVC